MKKLFFLIVLLFSESCKKDVQKNNLQACTENFAFVTIQVRGNTLTDYFTIRASTGDTLRFNSGPVLPEDYGYTVLDDSYVPSLKNQEDTFVFNGFIDREKVVEEPFVIKADVCHISYVSGKKTILID